MATTIRPSSARSISRCWPDGRGRASSRRARTSSEDSRSGPGRPERGVRGYPQGADQLHRVPKESRDEVQDLPGHEASLRRHAGPRTVPVDDSGPGMQVQIRADAGSTARAFLRGLVAGGCAARLETTWSPSGADEMPRRGKSCILLWMGGGPSQYESFDPKPGHACMGPRRRSRPTSRA